jgi:MFS family permease
MGVPSPPSTVYQRRWWTLVAIAISVIIVVLDSSIVNIALPTLQRELGATISDLQWIISAYIMVFAGLMLTAGSLGTGWAGRGCCRRGSSYLRSPAWRRPSRTAVPS